MGYWGDWLHEDVVGAAQFEEEQRQIKEGLQGQLCPSYEHIVARLKKEAVDGENRRQQEYQAQRNRRVPGVASGMATRGDRGDI